MLCLATAPVCWIILSPLRSNPQWPRTVSRPWPLLLLLHCKSALSLNCPSFYRKVVSHTLLLHILPTLLSTIFLSTPVFLSTIPYHFSFLRCCNRHGVPLPAVACPRSFRSLKSTGIYQPNPPPPPHENFTPFYLRLILDTPPVRTSRPSANKRGPRRASSTIQERILHHHHHQTALREDRR